MGDPTQMLATRSCQDLPLTPEFGQPLLCNYRYPYHRVRYVRDAWKRSVVVATPGHAIRPDLTRQDQRSPLDRVIFPFIL